MYQMRFTSQMSSRQANQVPTSWSRVPVLEGSTNVSSITCAVHLQDLEQQQATALVGNKHTSTHTLSLRRLVGVVESSRSGESPSL